MPGHVIRYPRLALVAAASAFAVVAQLLLAAFVAPQPAGADEHDEEHHERSHEIWALDQGEGVDRIHVYDPDLTELDVIDFEGWDVTNPHMIDFDSAFRYAFVANTASGNVAVIRTEDREVVDVIDTAAGAHMAAVTPDDSAVWVANIGGASFTEIAIDVDNEEFELSGRDLDVTEDPLWQNEFADVGPEDYTAAPVCHEYTADGKFAYVTLGPGAGGLVVVDLDRAEIVKAFDSDEVKANCGLARSADGAKMYANWGTPGDADDHDSGDGEWYVFDTASHELIGGPHSGEGRDTHGVRLAPDGVELWQVNRASGDGIVIDSTTDERIDDLDFGDETPDILDFSPDGSVAYVSLRGPNPQSGAAHAATGVTSGFAVVDVDSREVDEIVAPAEGSELEESSDFHGIGVRIIDASRRIAGADRIATAVAVSQDGFDDGAAGGVVLARSDEFADALPGAALAADVDGPLLLTGSEELSSATADELSRVLADGGTVHVLGGEAAVSAAVADEVGELGFAVERHEGADRYGTAVAIAEALGDPEVQLLATGGNFPDGLAAGAAAAHSGAAVLLTTPDGAPDVLADYLDANEGERYAVGGPAAQGHPDVEPLVGADRVATALEVADAFFSDPGVVGLARSDAFPDALAGGAHAGTGGGPLLLTGSTDLAVGVSGYVCGQRDSLSEVVAYGGLQALSADIVRGATWRWNGGAC